MSSITETRTLVDEIVDNADERELWIVGREFERPPYFHAGKGGDTRLARALRVCIDGRITPNSDGSYTVEGNEHRTYRVTDSCSCPNSQKAQSRWCYHSVAVALYIEWQRRIRNAAPVALGTLRPGTLPLPPVTVDERLAQRPAFNDEDLEARDMETHHMPQEDRMPDDEYLTAPDEQDAPVTVLDAADAAFPPMGQPATPATIKIPREFTVSIKGKMHVLYTGLVVAARANGLVTLSADWTYNDAELSLAHAVCTFADGRRYEESGDATPSNVNKGISMHFRRVALTRAKARCLRDALGISECSVEEMDEDGGKRDTPVMTPPTDQNYRRRIWTRVQELAPDVSSREDVEAFIKEHTGLGLHPDQYAAIASKLGA